MSPSEAEQLARTIIEEFGVRVDVIHMPGSSEVRVYEDTPADGQTHYNPAHAFGYALTLHARRGSPWTAANHRLRRQSDRVHYVNGTVAGWSTTEWAYRPLQHSALVYITGVVNGTLFQQDLMTLDAARDHYEHRVRAGAEVAVEQGFMEAETR